MRPSAIMLLLLALPLAAAQDTTVWSVTSPDPEGLLVEFVGSAASVAARFSVDGRAGHVGIYLYALDRSLVSTADVFVADGSWEIQTEGSQMAGIALTLMEFGAVEAWVTGGLADDCMGGCYIVFWMAGDLSAATFSLDSTDPSAEAEILRRGFHTYVSDGRGMGSDSHARVTAYGRRAEYQAGGETAITFVGTGLGTAGTRAGDAFLEKISIIGPESTLTCPCVLRDFASGLPSGEHIITRDVVGAQDGLPEAFAFVDVVW